MAARLIWGIEVRRGRSGRTVWPAALKDEVARRPRVGVPASQIARELGTTAPLVRKWERGSRPVEKIVVNRPSPFAELMIEGVDWRKLTPTRCIKLEIV